MILLYHGVVPDTDPVERQDAGQALALTSFKNHIFWLLDHYKIVPLTEYMYYMKSSAYDAQKIVALTFDDGLRRTFQCVFPFLIEQKVPATFFVTTGHLEHGELLWFSYLNALCFERDYIKVKVDGNSFLFQTAEQRKQAFYELATLAKVSGDPVGFCKMLAKSYPIPTATADLFEGMTHKQIIEASKSALIEIGGHTITHPYLNQLSRDLQEQEILEGNRVLSSLLGKTVRFFAYPGGEYDNHTIELVKALGFEAAFAVIPKHLDKASKFEIERFGIYSPSLLKLQMKVKGGKLIRRFGMRIG